MLENIKKILIKLNRQFLLKLLFFFIDVSKLNIIYSISDTVIQHFLLSNENIQKNINTNSKNYIILLKETISNPKYKI